MIVKEICKKHNISIEKKIVLFDGTCNLCNFFVRIILKYDKKDVFRLDHLNSPFSKEINETISNKAEGKLQTVILISNDKTYTFSTAALLIMKELGIIGKMIYCFIVLPPFIRDNIYKLIARSRYFLFGKRNKCRILNKKERAKFNC